MAWKKNAEFLVRGRARPRCQREELVDAFASETQALGLGFVAFTQARDDVALAFGRRDVANPRQPFINLRDVAVERPGFLIQHAADIHGEVARLCPHVAVIDVDDDRIPDAAAIVTVSREAVRNVDL